MNQNKFREILQKYTAGTATPREQIQVEYFYQKLQQENRNIANVLTDFQKKKIKDAIDAHISTENQSGLFSIQKYDTLAAVMVVLIGISLLMAFLLGGNTITVSTARGEHKQLAMADGSHIYLNANSSISYRKDFENKREIVLTGEAFFEVARNPQKPFTVTAREVEAKVLGTSFNINSKNPEKTVISVNTGSVRVKSKKGPDKKSILTKNQQIVFQKGEPAKVTMVNSANLMAWSRNVILLDGATLSQTAKILENWYDVTIDFEDVFLEKGTLSGKFKEEKVENVLSSIAVLKNLKIEYLTPKHILIRKNTP
ncbi:MAG TPA: DUF4974 domain-containing protein [Leeuwenhoekiella sp.]|nr:DUF4974 domain-containing protein [Leeuwenhoekiella sp.]